MRRTNRCLTALIFIFLTGSIALADKGQVYPYPVHLAEGSQKAIILYNQADELLILGTELKADQEMSVLEFIPFPSEPEVVPAKGNPFDAARFLISQKKLHFIERTKGGGGLAPVEIKFQAQVGLHDVTVIKINDLAEFSNWVAGFFKKKGIHPKTNLSGVYQNAADYLQRGYNYFVFDYVPVKKEAKFIEPLCYRFKTEKLYYPLKTSNIIGGEGRIDLALILPGSLGLLTDGGDFRRLRELFGSAGEWDLSSSAKVYPDELAAIYPEAGAFFQTGKIYMQVLRFSGKYEFIDDLAFDISKIAPYAYKHIIYTPDYGNYFEGGSYELAESLSPDEKKDIAEAYSQKRPEWLFEPEIIEAINDLINPGEVDGK
jgi:hypothetical protein